jgi:CrcB protein
VEVVVLTDAGASVTVLGYLFASVVGGVLAVAAGIRAARRGAR